MEIKEFIKNFADQFDDIDPGVFTSNTAFHELEDYSSLAALSIIAMVDEEYGVTIGADEIKSSVTIEDLFKKVQEKTNK